MEKEKCVRCGKQLPNYHPTPVTVRRYFVEGAGQLRSECWRKLYERENPLEVAIFDRRTIDS